MMSPSSAGYRLCTHSGPRYNRGMDSGYKIHRVEHLSRCGGGGGYRQCALRCLQRAVIQITKSCNSKRSDGRQCKLSWGLSRPVTTQPSGIRSSSSKICKSCKKKGKQPVDIQEVPQQRLGFHSRLHRRPSGLCICLPASNLDCRLLSVLQHHWESCVRQRCSFHHLLTNRSRLQLPLAGGQSLFSSAGQVGQVPLLLLVVFYHRRLKLQWV
jgi:hypothetical protein